MEREDAAANSAIAILSKQPLWAQVQESISKANLDWIQHSEDVADQESRPIKALKRLTKVARTCMGLITDSPTADAFCDLLPLLIRGAYQQCYGVPPQTFEAVSLEARRFERKIQECCYTWIGKAYRLAQKKEREGRTVATVGLSQEKKRGRPQKISNEQKRKALKVPGGKERAKILYETLYPTAQQIKNVSTILRHYSRKRHPDER
jgi:hypothetical protein